MMTLQPGCVVVNLTVFNHTAIAASLLAGTFKPVHVFQQLGKLGIALIDTRYDRVFHRLGTNTSPWVSRRGVDAFHQQLGEGDPLMLNVFGISSPVVDQPLLSCCRCLAGAQ